MAIGSIEIDDGKLKGGTNSSSECLNRLVEKKTTNCCYELIGTDDLGNYRYLKSEQFEISRGEQKCFVCSDEKYEVVSDRVIDQEADCDIQLYSWEKIDEISCDCEENNSYHVFEIYELDEEGNKKYKAKDKETGDVKELNTKPECKDLVTCSYPLPSQDVCEYNPETKKYEKYTYTDFYENGEWVKTEKVGPKGEYDTKLDCIGGVKFRWLFKGGKYICEGLKAYPSSKLQYATDEAPTSWIDMDPEQRRRAQEGDFKLDGSTVSKDDIKSIEIKDDANAKNLCGYEPATIVVSKECDGLDLYEKQQKVYQLKDGDKVLKTIYANEEPKSVLIEKNSAQCRDLVRISVNCCEHKDEIEYITCDGDCDDNTKCYECSETTRYEIKCYQEGYYDNDGVFQPVGGVITERGISEVNSKECGGEWTEVCQVPGGTICFGDDLYEAQIKGTRKCNSGGCEPCEPVEGATPKIGALKEKGNTFCKNGGIHVELAVIDCNDYKSYEYYDEKTDTFVCDATPVRMWVKVMVNHSEDKNPSMWVNPTEEEIKKILYKNLIDADTYALEPDGSISVLVETGCRINSDYEDDPEGETICQEI